ncbi:hypothetical protein RSSM_04966 [Rhodopirellula sallentina SM41]|uniref:Uncharacterized protein n=1 Tax=Rhodopirellula sallentina SM41 TaxID=1263870 RepID=M5U6W9_9BACT|nr:hypothetical protein RSSM_04966 [Rhodopirellula sallentina SM41]
MNVSCWSACYSVRLTLQCEFCDMSEKVNPRVENAVSKRQTLRRCHQR